MTPPRNARPKIREPQRQQAEIRFEVPEDALAADHPARLLWNVLGGLDLSAFLAETRTTQNKAGRAELSPRMKLTLWCYGIACGIGSAREIARRTKTDIAFRWIVGDLKVGHHCLSQFRAERGEAFDKLFTDVVAELLARDLIDLSVMAQDGMRVRASAGAPSFRTHGSLLECREQAALHLKAVLAQADDRSLTLAQQARREAAARDLQQRVEQAIEACRAQRQAHPDAVARGSTTDAEARIMKMADGGFRPAFNVQYGTVGSAFGGPRTIVAVRVTNVGSDFGSLVPVVEQVKSRTGRLPGAVLADANHAQHDQIAKLSAMGVQPVVAVPKPRHGLPRGSQADRSPEVQAWRAFMASEPGKELARRRGGLAELVNARHRLQHQLRQLLVRGVPKALNVVLLGALTSNLLQHAPKLLS